MKITIAYDSVFTAQTFNFAHNRPTKRAVLRVTRKYIEDKAARADATRRVHKLLLNREPGVFTLCAYKPYKCRIFN